MDQPSILLPSLLHPEKWIDTIPWKPFRPGVQAHFLYGRFGEGPSAALLRYQPGAGVPLHEHTGYEHVFIIKGDQVDRNGQQLQGSLIINPPGTSHVVQCPGECVVLVIWEKPVKFL